MLDSKTFENEAIRLQRTSYIPNLHMPPHTDELSKISIVLAGSVVERAAGTKAVGSAGSVFIKPNHASHENHFSESPVMYLTINFKDDAVFAKYFNSWEFVDHPRTYVRAVRMWAELKKVRNDRQLNETLRLFASEILPQCDDSISCIHWCNHLKNLLTQDRDKPKSISVLSEKIGLHRVYVGRKFKKLYGTSPSEYRIFARTAAALIDLLVTDKSISSIALDSGFADQSHLTRTIRRQLGFTPATFRRIAW